MLVFMTPSGSVLHGPMKNPLQFKADLTHGVAWHSVLLLLLMLGTAFVLVAVCVTQVPF